MTSRLLLSKALSVSTKRGSKVSMIMSSRSLRPLFWLSMATPISAFSAVAATASSTGSVVIPQETQTAIDGLEPKLLWEQFAIVSSIPRPSKQEEAVLKYIREDFCGSRSSYLTWKQDSVGNLAVFHPGCGKVGPKAPPVLLQGHVDMVTEKNQETQHNFETDPIRLRRLQDKQSWLGAYGTTLGADNGIGVAAMLALLATPPDTPDVELPPLQALFTVDEETGLTGATDLDVEALGLTSRTMLNLDTEEWGELYIGCAGGGESVLELPMTRSTVSTSSQLIELRVQGLLGGHSGINIHEGRGNAVLLCAGTTHSAIQTIPGVQLVSLTGGDKHNAIPREASAVLSVDTEANPDAMNQLELLVLESSNAAKVEYGTLEQGLQMTVSPIDVEKDETCPNALPFTAEATSTFLSTLLALPHGPLKFSHAIPDLVETSNNVASVSFPEDDRATIMCSTRSSIGTALEATRAKIAAIASLAGANIKQTPAYPGWVPNRDSELLQMAQGLLETRLPKDQKVGIKAIHAGLECGLLIEKLGGTVDALSFGPTITGAHSPDEMIEIDTVLPFFELVQDILGELARKES